MKKRYFVIAAVLCLLFLLSACGSSNVVRKMPAENATIYKIEGSVNATVDSTKLTVEFNSNFIKGTQVQISIDSYDGEELFKEIVTVEGENMTLTYDIKDEWKDKKVYVSAFSSAAVGSQPREINDAYGRYFQNVDGDFLMWNTAENMILIQSDKIIL